jgi:hypothetical protein
MKSNSKIGYNSKIRILCSLILRISSSHINHQPETKRGVGGRPEAIKRRNAAIEWCEDQGIEFMWDSNESLWRFRFRTEEDATMFKLAWGI